MHAPPAASLFTASARSAAAFLPNVVRASASPGVPCRVQVLFSCALKPGSAQYASAQLCRSRELCLPCPSGGRPIALQHPSTYQTTRVDTGAAYVAQEAHQSAGMGRETRGCDELGGGGEQAATPRAESERVRMMFWMRPVKVTRRCR